ncbi:Cyclopropane-fatty-acyl-phospholipid synthase [Trifolium repens]|nr:Cyclopropane-fatty-acyl-phospholipid synthase [Trifolium repens]
MRVAVVGAGISGLVSAYTLAKAGVNVVLYEKEDYLGGNVYANNTLPYDFDNLDHNLGIMLLNPVNYPNIMELFESLGVDVKLSYLSTSVSLDNGYEWGTQNAILIYLGLTKILNTMKLWGISLSQGILRIISEGLSALIPLCGSIWPCSSPEGVFSFSAFSVLSFLSDHHLLQVKEKLVSENCQIKVNCKVQLVSSSDKGCSVLCEDGSHEMYDGCIMAVHAPDALTILGDEATSNECRILGAFQYVNSDIFLHRDKSLMPRNPIAWSAWNILETSNNNVCVTYWINILQENIEETTLPFFVTINPNQTPQNTLLKWSTGHVVPTITASKAFLELDHIQGKRKIWFSSGAYKGYGYYGNGLKHMTFLEEFVSFKATLEEMGARFFVTRFLSAYITTGSLMLLEEGGTIFTFEGSKKKCPVKSVLRIHNPKFYWKVMTNGDLGLASAYIDGDFSFVDTNKGLLNFILILIANRDFNASQSTLKNRGWWTPVFFTAGLASAKFFIKHVSRKNTVTQARRNISMHYDLSNELFACFLDEKMQYSCGVFKNEEEDLKEAQKRKISILIEKARIDRKHEILDIGCGWGGFAIEVVRQTGCKYTGITLSKEQLKYAENKVKEAGLKDHITFLLCDYRQLSKTRKYDRIISCEMIEAVGHEYMEDFFSCCDSALADDGLLVLQTMVHVTFLMSSMIISCIQFILQIYIGYSVEHAENIGIHYYLTLRWWRKNFLENHSKIMALGFDEKFIRIWEYYFDYCAAGFKSRTLGNYQVLSLYFLSITQFQRELKFETIEISRTSNLFGAPNGHEINEETDKPEMHYDRM